MNLLRKTKSLQRLIRALAVVLAVAFGVAGSACLVESTLTAGPDESKASPHHHDADADHGDQQGDDSHDCCASLQSVVLPALQSNLLPDQPAGSSVLAAVVMPLSVSVPVTTGLLDDHGPPGESPPAFLLVRSVSPRAPPVSA